MFSKIPVPKRNNLSVSFLQSRLEVCIGKAAACFYGPMSNWRAFSFWGMLIYFFLFSHILLRHAAALHSFHALTGQGTHFLTTALYTRSYEANDGFFFFGTRLPTRCTGYSNVLWLRACTE